MCIFPFFILLYGMSRSLCLLQICQCQFNPTAAKTNKILSWKKQMELSRLKLTDPAGASSCWSYLYKEILFVGSDAHGRRITYQERGSFDVLKIKLPMVHFFSLIFLIYGFSSEITRG